MRPSFEVIIVGAGTGGLVLADLLARRGYRTAVLERQPSYTPVLRGEIIQPNGLRILDQLGLLEEVKAAGSHPNYVFHFHRIGGPRLCTIDYRMLPTPYGYSLITLPQVLMTFLLKRVTENRNIQVHWGTDFISLLLENGRVAGVRVRDNRAGHEQELSAPLVIGADGVFSRVREEMKIQYRLKTYGHGYLTLFLKRPGGFGQEGRYYVGRKTILGLFPVSDSSLYAFYLISSERRPTPSFKDPLGELEALKHSISSIDPMVKESLGEITRWEQVGYMPCWRVKASSWVTDGAALMGDAAHAMNPHASQGRNQTLEDAIVLSNLISECLRRGDFSRKALSAYESERRKKVDRLQRLADEETFFWNAGDPVRTWVRDRVFRVLDRNDRLRYKMLAQVAGLEVDPYSPLDYLKAAGFFPDAQAGQRP